MAHARVRDPLLAAPLLPEPRGGGHSSGRCRSRAAGVRRATARANTTIRILKGLAVGDLRGTETEHDEFGAAAAWESAGAPAREVSERVALAHKIAEDTGLYSSDLESAVVRLTQASVMDYAGPALAVGAGDPPKGEIVPLSAGIASLPPAGTTAAELTQISPKALSAFSGFASTMLVPSDTLDMEEIARTRVYEDASLKNASRKVEFAADLFEAGMLSFTHRRVCAVSVFFVVKQREPAGLRLRPVWDCRRVNKFFVKPPAISLGGPQVLSRLELSPEIVQGRRLESCWGDVPDFFHRCATPPVVWPYFVLDGVSPKSLQEALRRRGVHLAISARRRFVCLRVAIMGWSWAPCLCHGALEDMLLGVHGFPEGGQAIDAKTTPDFITSAFVFWLYMDDYCSTTLVDEGTPSPMAGILAGARRTLEGHGLAAHKEGLGTGVPKSLGITISPDLVLQALTEKLGVVIAATRGILRRGRASGKQLQRLMGHWVWILMCARPGLAVISSCYAFVHKAGDHHKEELPLWRAVREELHALVFLGPLFRTSLASPWRTTVFASDASEEGFGVVSCQASLPEVRAEAATGIDEKKKITEDTCKPKKGADHGDR